MPVPVFFDLRYRLTKAERYNSGDTLQKRYTYTYDDGDNRSSKVIHTPPSTTTTYVYEHNDANELTKQSVGGTDTTFAYDAWGRLTSKAQGETYSATYTYRYGVRLRSVTSDFPGEGTVTYDYYGDGRRHERVAGGTTTRYNWDLGFNVVSEEDSQGTLSKTYVHGLADISGTNPSTGTYRYYFQDNIGSTRRLRDSNRNSLGVYEYTPYGEIYSESGDTITYMFTGKEWDSTADLYYFLFRYYSPALGRWMIRDPVPSLNLYPYCLDNPATYVNPNGAILPWLASGAVGAIVGGIVGGISSAVGGEGFWEGALEGAVVGGLAGLGGGIGIAAGGTWGLGAFGTAALGGMGGAVGGAAGAWATGGNVGGAAVGGAFGGAFGGAVAGDIVGPVTGLTNNLISANISIWTNVGDMMAEVFGVDPFFWLPDPCELESE